SVGARGRRAGAALAGRVWLCGRRLAGADRVWLIDVDGTPPQALAGTALRLRSVYRAGDIRLALYSR
ncbi:MAG TPA: hypothetical protein VEO01_21925, partial [Pseudonocardiaceae bacterium]|nr:hypothetical protein [Pseudonocardiaceae bacterium]